MTWYDRLQAMTTIPLWFAFAIHIVCLVAFVVGLREYEPRMIRTAAALYGNWIAVIAFNALFHVTTPEWWFLFVDIVAGVAIMVHPANRMQVLIAVPFGPSIALHVLRLTIGQPQQHDYWFYLLVLSTVQLGMLFGWGVGNNGGARNHGRSGGAGMADTPLASRMERP